MSEPARNEVKIADFRGMASTPPKVDLTGEEFGRWTVTGFSHRVPKKKGTKLYWMCLCECGTERAVSVTLLRSGKSTSCGCKIASTAGAGMTSHPLYFIWKAMLSRCYNPGNKRYPRYGGRGIAVCQKWRDCFVDFAEDMGPKPSPDHSLDRRDNDGDYEPGNVRWATSVQQNRNFSRNRLVEHDGEAKSISEWAQSIGMRRSTLVARLNAGLTMGQAIELPVKRGRGSWQKRLVLQ